MMLEVRILMDANNTSVQFSDGKLVHETPYDCQQRPAHFCPDYQDDCDNCQCADGNDCVFY